MLGLGRRMAPCIAAQNCNRGRCSQPWQQRALRLSCLQPRHRQLRQELVHSRTQLEPSRRRGSLQVEALAPKGHMSLQQRVRVTKNILKDQFQHLGSVLSTLPPVAALLQLLAVIDRKLQPLYNFLVFLIAKGGELIDSYNNFLAEETKRRWSWENKYANEIERWKLVPPYLFFLGCTVLYEVFVPVSVVAALVVPLYYAWVLWDRWWLSPIFLGVLIMTPLKFCPWADICWVWPGLV